MPSLNPLTSTLLDSISNDETLLAPVTTAQILFFQERLLEWFEREGRHDLPWKPQKKFSQKINLYRIWISEIMLQQTQVTTVLPYFERFMAAFPSPEDLAAADEEMVLKLWQGLGYYSRARNLHAAAKQLVEKFNGNIPPDFESIRSLKGIGDTTANAILAQGFNLPFAILDGNVRRVLARVTGMTAPRKALDKRLKPVSEVFLCHQNPADYTQAIMDFGATLCKLKAECDRCFLKSICTSYQYQKVGDIPAKAPKKETPTESIALFVLRNSHYEILLEKRPKNGIWGNLYSLPELLLQGRNMQQKSSFLLQNYTLQYFSKRRSLTNIVHQFTHYRLDASVFEVLVTDYPEFIANLESGENSPYRWVSAEDLHQYPAPKPIADIFEKYFTTTKLHNS